eukprot:CAMPEP_0206148704 /NCGR_PEP_ID=MMETSP1473-20131121/37389_1 /ASSEMBLY_ACC=CAM_ASM_001109 /TAXON_ID=1461547 /ORGANISM="Stichococcus sp, Strain RCC1054" /LENGTH=1295 /DNA_ID=CAMNT_0053546125 /DNA_START=128 /DNA_END=4016 /DNA_ORIENTATION=-
MPADADLLLALAAAAETAAPGVTDDYGRGCRHCGVERTRQERTAPVKAACHAAVAEVEPLFCDSKAVAPLTAIDLDEHAQPPCPAAAAMVYPDKGCTGNSCCSVADRLDIFRRSFGDEAGLRCEPLVKAARDAAQQAVSAAAGATAEGDRLRRGRGRWHRARLYHLMRQVYVDAELLKNEGDVLRDAERAFLLARGLPLVAFPDIEAASDIVWDEVQALALTRAESSPSPARRDRWTTADLRYAGCERLILPLIDSDLADPLIVSLLQSKPARYNASGGQPSESGPAEIAARSAKLRRRRRPSGPPRSAAEISARRAAAYVAEVAEAAEASASVHSHAEMPVRHQGGWTHSLSATSWALMLLLASVAVVLVYQTRARSRTWLPPPDLRQQLQDASTGAAPKSKQARQARRLRKSQSALARVEAARTAAAQTEAATVAEKKAPDKPASHADADDMASTPTCDAACSDATSSAESSTLPADHDGGSGALPLAAEGDQPPPPPLLRKQGSQGDDSASTGSMSSGLTPTTPAQGLRPPLRHTRDDASTPDLSPPATPQLSPRGPPGTDCEASSRSTHSGCTSSSSGGLNSLSGGGSSDTLPAAPRSGGDAPTPPLRSKAAKKRAQLQPEQRLSGKGGAGGKTSKQSPTAQYAAAPTRPGRLISAPAKINANPQRFADLPAADRPVEKGRRQQARRSAAAPSESRSAQLNGSRVPYGTPVSRPQSPSRLPTLPQQQHLAEGAIIQHQQWQPQTSHALQAEPDALAMQRGMSDDIDNLLADAWAFTTEGAGASSTPPERRPELASPPPPVGGSTALSFQEQPAPVGFHQTRQPSQEQGLGQHSYYPQHHSYGSRGASPLARTISSASSDCTSASGNFSAARLHGSAGATERQPLGGGYNPHTTMRARSPGLGLSRALSNSSGSGSFAFFMPPASVPLPAAQACTPSAQTQLLSFQAHSAVHSRPGAPQELLLPESLSEGFSDAYSPGGARSGQDAVPPRVPGAGPLSFEPWPPAQADAPGMRARLGPAASQAPAPGAPGFVGTGAADAVGWVPAAGRYDMWSPSPGSRPGADAPSERVGVQSPHSSSLPASPVLRRGLSAAEASPTAASCGGSPFASSSATFASFRPTPPYEPVARYPSAGSTTSDPGVRPPLHASHVVRSTLRPGSAAFVPAAAAHLSSGGCPAAEVNTTASDPDAAAPTQYPHVMGYTRTHYNAGTSPQNGTHAISSPGGMSARARSFQLGSVVIDESLGLLVADGGVPAFEPSGTGVEAMRQVPVAARCGPSYDPRDSGHQGDSYLQQ